MSEERDVLDLLHEILENDRAFYPIVRFLDSATRNSLVAAHMRNSNLQLAFLRQYIASPATLTLNIPIGGMDTSGNFFDPVTVAPTQPQIDAAIERHVGIQDTNCAICQDTVTCATRIRACGHCFHHQCISQWFTMNTRCPVCRHDIRDLQRGVVNLDNATGRRMYSDS